MSRLGRFLSVIMVLALGGVITLIFINNPPQVQRRKYEVQAPLVRVMAARPVTERVWVTAMGAVIPARAVVLQPRVTGNIVGLSPKLIPGGFFKQGELICRIDPRDYEIAVTQQKAAVERARFQLKQEQGRSVVARREWKLLEKDVEKNPAGRALALREPHLANAKEALAAAESGLKLARLNLERARIVAPFNVLVLTESVDLGQLVTPQTLIAKLVGTDECWVQAAVPLDRLRRIALPDKDSLGAAVKVRLETAGGGSEYAGRVLRLLGDLDPVGRMARLLVVVDDPFGRKAGAGAGAKKVPLLLGTYVRVEIDAGEMAGVYVIPRTALREGGRVWLLDDKDQLVVREVAVVWRRPETVLIGKGLQPGDRVIVSSLATPVPGMKLRPAEAKEPRVAQVLEPVREAQETE